MKNPKILFQRHVFVATSGNQMDFRLFVRIDKFPIGANMGLLTALVLFAGDRLFARGGDRVANLLQGV